MERGRNESGARWLPRRAVFSIAFLFLFRNSRGCCCSKISRARFRGLSCLFFPFQRLGGKGNEWSEVPSEGAGRKEGGKKERETPRSIEKKREKREERGAPKARRTTATTGQRRKVRGEGFAFARPSFFHSFSLPAAFFLSAVSSFRIVLKPSLPSLGTSLSRASCASCTPETSELSLEACGGALTDANVPLASDDDCAPLRCAQHRVCPRQCFSSPFLSPFRPLAASLLCLGAIFEPSEGSRKRNEH